MSKPTINTADARAYVGPLRVELEEPGARCAKAHGLHLIGLVERLADAHDAAQAELCQREDMTARYERLVEDWNGLWTRLRELGVEVSGHYRAGDEGVTWRWRWGQQHGEEASIPAAAMAALRAAGAKKPPPPPLDQQLRAQGAPELPGLRAYDPPPNCDTCGLPLLNGGIADEVLLQDGEGRRRRTHRVCADSLRGQGWHVVAVAKGA